MKTKSLSLLIAAALVITQFPIALAQTQSTSGDWSAVKAMGADERLIVKQKDGKTIEGKMIEANDTNLTMSRNNAVVNISRDSNRQIQHVRERLRRPSG